MTGNPNNLVLNGFWACSAWHPWAQRECQLAIPRCWPSRASMILADAAFSGTRRLLLGNLPAPSPYDSRRCRFLRHSVGIAWLASSLISP